MITRKRKQYVDTKNTLSSDNDSDNNSDNDSDSYNSGDFLDLEKEISKRQKIDKKGSKILQTVKNYIDSQEPDLETLIRTPLLLEDRVKLFLHYEQYKQEIPHTYEWVSMRNLYNSMFKDYVNNYSQIACFTKRELDNLNVLEEELKLYSQDSQTMIRYKILTLDVDISIKKILYESYQELLNLKTNGDEYTKRKQWLKWAISVPYKTEQIDYKMNIKDFMVKCKEKLDKELYGMDNVKEQLLVYMNSKLLNPKAQRTNLALVGPPGIGKTKIAKLVAEMLGWGFEHISLGGIQKLSFLKGFEYTYTGSEPGLIAKSVCRLGHSHGVLLLDEMDKIGNSTEISSFMLHVTDSSQNYNFRDTYLAEIPINLSNLWFIASMNSKNIDKILLDRFWIIDVDGYTQREQESIIRLHTLPKILKNLSLKKTDIKFDHNVIYYIIEHYIDDSDRGVRSLEKITQLLVDRIMFLVNNRNSSGELPFKMSFSTGTSLSYPVLVTRELADKLLTGIKQRESVFYIS